MTPFSLAALVLLGAPAGPPAGKPDQKPDQKMDQMWEVLGHFDTYPNAQPFPIADAVETRGMRFRTAGFATPDAPARVVAFYRREFEREGLRVFDQPDQGEILGIATYDQKTQLERTILVQPGHGGPSKVTLSYANGAELMRVAESKPNDQTDGLPVHPSGVAVRSDAIDGDKRTTTVSYHAIVSPSAVVAWLVPRLRAIGWVGETDSGDPSAQTLSFRRGSETLVVSAVSAGRGASVTYTHAE